MDDFVHQDSFIVLEMLFRGSGSSEVYPRPGNIRKVARRALAARPCMDVSFLIRPSLQHTYPRH